MKPKKSLGQHFLTSTKALDTIVQSGDLSEADTVLEIGPGKGALTSKLLEKGGTVLAVEKDRELFEFLKEKFVKEISENKLILINGDILEFNISEVFSSFSNGDVAKQDILRKTSKIFHYKIVANIPYNITGAILKKFLTAENQPERMILMVQHEVAKRIMARDGKESILSISVKAYGEPKIIIKVPARYFSPAPKVDSAIISIKNISREKFTSPQPSPYKGEGGNRTVQDKSLNSQIFEEKFWKIVKAGFAHKRKKLSSNLKVLKFEKNILTEKLGNKRAEDLTLSDWLALTKMCYN